MSSIHPADDFDVSVKIVFRILDKMVAGEYVFVDLDGAILEPLRHFSHEWHECTRTKNIDENWCN